MNMKVLIAAVAAASVLSGVVSADTIDVEVADSRFAPRDVYINPGDTIHWFWTGFIPHSTTSAGGLSEVWDSGLQSNGTFEYTFNSTGRFGYYCTLHGADQGNNVVVGMAGYVIVVDPIALSSPQPGVAGQVNTLTVTTATPGETVYYVYGFGAGSAPVPGCGGVTADMSSPVLAGTSVADGSGVATYSGFVPDAVSGRAVRLQAVELSNCRKSNLVVHQF